MTPEPVTVTPEAREAAEAIVDLFDDATKGCVKLGGGVKIIQQAMDAAVAAATEGLRAERDAHERIVAGVQAGLEKEFANGSGHTSGDILDDFGVWVDHHAEVERERNELRGKVFMLGTWKCDKCGFEQNNRVLNPATGECGVLRIEEVQVCPNDGQAMRRVTWEECSQSNYEAATRFLDERDAANVQRDIALSQLEAARGALRSAYDLIIRHHDASLEPIQSGCICPACVRDGVEDPALNEIAKCLHVATQPETEGKA